METHIEGKMNGVSYGGYMLWSLIYRVQCMETHKRVQCLEIHIEGTMYGDSYRGYNIRSLVWRVQCMETHI